MYWLQPLTNNDVCWLQAFSTTFFNKTSNIVEAPTWVDFELLGLYGGFVATLAGIGAPRQFR